MDTFLMICAEGIGLLAYPVGIIYEMVVTGFGAGRERTRQIRDKDRKTNDPK